ncbi:MAG: heme-binding protein [Treponema sp.]|jgi:uncharacterized protein (UPF0303 family)|nr:heme-binding protein [Treponema sp.]
MNVDKYIVLVEKQEEQLQFPHFNRKDAWDLGKIFAEEILNKNYALSVSIRLLNGLILFQYSPEGTVLNNESWMARKFNTVREMETSTLLFTLRMQRGKQTLENRVPEPKLYVTGGGGFPIRVAGTGLVGAALVSGLPGVQDHNVLVECISRYLKARDVPVIPEKAKL